MKFFGIKRREPSRKEQPLASTVNGTHLGTNTNGKDSTPATSKPTIPSVTLRSQSLTSVPVQPLHVQDQQLRQQQLPRSSKNPTVRSSQTHLTAPRALKDGILFNGTNKQSNLPHDSNRIHAMITQSRPKSYTTNCVVSSLERTNATKHDTSLRKNNSTTASLNTKLDHRLQPNNGEKEIERKRSPQSILHVHKQLPSSVDYDLSPENIPQNRVRFVSSASSVASSSAASEVHLMAGPGSVGSSSAMSSSRDVENVFDKVLHMVMAEEEARLKAMGMNRAGAPSFAGHSPSMRYSNGMYNVNTTESDDASNIGLLPTPIDTAWTVGPAPIDLDTGLELGSYRSDSLDYHDVNDEEIDERKYRSLLKQSALSESTASGTSDCAVNGSLTKELRARSHERSRQNLSLQARATSYRKWSSHGS